MAKIIALSTYKEQCAVRDGYRLWKSLFEGSLDVDTRLSDLQPGTLIYLSEAGDESTTAIYALIIGFSGLGASTTFESLEPKQQNRLLDIFLFISDQIRFEIMYRLGWLDHFAGNRFSLFELVTAFEKARRYCQDHLPHLAKDHEDYDDYAGLYERDQQVFIRHMFTSSFNAFKQLHQIK